MLLQKIADRRAKFIHVPLDRVADKLRLVRIADGVTIPVWIDWIGVRPHRIDNAASLSFFQHRHERIQSVQAAGKSGISIELYQQFLFFVDRQAVV